MADTGRSRTEKEERWRAECTSRFDVSTGCVCTYHVWAAVIRVRPTPVPPHLPTHRGQFPGGCVLHVVTRPTELDGGRGGAPESHLHIMRETLREAPAGQTLILLCY